MPDQILVLLVTSGNVALLLVLIALLVYVKKRIGKNTAEEVNMFLKSLQIAGNSIEAIIDAFNVDSLIIKDKKLKKAIDIAKITFNVTQATFASELQQDPIKFKNRVLDTVTSSLLEQGIKLNKEQQNAVESVISLAVNKLSKVK